MKNHLNSSHMFLIGSDFDKLTIHTPVNAKTLANLLGDYLDRQFVIEGFSFGFSLQVKEANNLTPISKVCTACQELMDKIADEVEKGRIVGPFSSPPTTPLMISPICVIPKSDGKKYRMIFNLSAPKGRSHPTISDFRYILLSATRCCLADP